MKKLWSLGAMAALLVFGHAVRSAAQEPAKDAKSADAKAGDTAKAPEGMAKEESSVTDHTIRIGDQTIGYKATASTTLLKDDKGEPTALIYSTAYTRSDVKDFSQRPIAFLYNGGPGSASIWLHMGAFGPRRIVTENASSTPPAPYKLVDNTESLLDKTDMVFIDPVGTGFSHAAGKAQDKDFWGVDQDVKSLAQFITTYVNRNNRWNSPKFLIGESYGTFRSVALGNYLQTADGMYINGIVLISNVIDASSLAFAPGDDRCYIYFLPTYAAAAWHYKVAKNPPPDLNAWVDSARQFASTEYAAALMKGTNLGQAETADIAKKLSAFTGLSEDYLIKAELRVTLPQFNAELLRSRGIVIGRYDSRFMGNTYDLLTENSEFDPSYTAVVGAFAAAFNSYVRDDLKFGQDKNYKVLPNEPGQNWDWKHNAPPGGFFPSAPNVGNDLVKELLDNPSLRVQVENGYFDGATPFYATEYTIDHLLLPPAARARIDLKYYTSGHMIYLHDEDRVKLKGNIAAFIEGAAKH